MQVVPRGPLPVASVLWHTRREVVSYALTVVCKATYELRPGTSALAPRQDPIRERDELEGGDPARGLWAPADLVPYKSRADVILVGHAYAPAGAPVRSLVARLVVGDLDKAVEVWCDRRTAVDGRLFVGQPFVRTPLGWSRAAGGPGTVNPLGIAFDTAPDTYGTMPVPNLQPVGVQLTGKGDRFAPIGFGPIPATWPARVAKLGPQGLAGLPPTWNQAAMPEGIDYAFFNAAPPDQQPSGLRADERIVLENLHPAHPKLTTSLPGIAPQAVVSRPGQAPETLSMIADTLWFDTDRGICTMTWRALVSLRHPAEEGVVTITADEPARPGADPSRTVAPWFASGGPRAAVLPFSTPQAASESIPPPVATPAPAAPAAPPPEPSKRPKAVSTAKMSAVTTLAPGVAPVIAEPLPFRSTPDAGSPPPAEPPPFVSAPIAPPPMVPGAPAPAELGDEAPEGPRRRPTPPPPPMLGVVPLQSAMTPMMVEPTKPAFLGAIVSAEPAPISMPESPPALLAPIAPIAPITLGAPITQVAPSAPPPPAVNPADIPVERFAAIAAELAEGREPRAAILHAHELTERSWAAVERHHRGAIEQEVKRGRTRLSGAHDRAYVEAVEGFRGPITLDEYARIKVGMEQERVNEVLDALKIQRPALMPIVRVWTKKTASDPRHSVEIMRLLAKHRAE